MPMKLVEPLAQSPGFAAKVGSTTWGRRGGARAELTVHRHKRTVAVLDTGIDATHPSFAGVQLVQRDFTGAGSANDTNGHGIHCAGNDIWPRRGWLADRRRDRCDHGGDRQGTRRTRWRRQRHPLRGDHLGSGRGRQRGSMSLGIDFPGWVEELVNNNGFSIPVATSIAVEQCRANIRPFEQPSNFLAARAAVAQTVVVTAASGNENGRDATPPFAINVAPLAASAGVVAVGALGEERAGCTSLRSRTPAQRSPPPAWTSPARRSVAEPASRAARAWRHRM